MCREGEKKGEQPENAVLSEIFLAHHLLCSKICRQAAAKPRTTSTTCAILLNEKVKNIRKGAEEGQESTVNAPSEG